MELCQAPLLPRIVVKFGNDNCNQISSMLIAIQKKKKKKTFQIIRYITIVFIIIITDRENAI